MKFKKLLVFITLCCIVGITVGCGKQNDSTSVTQDNDISPGYTVNESDDKIILIFPIAEDGFYADKVTATALSGENNSEIYEFDNHEGTFVLSTLGKGTYEIAASRNGYETETRVVIVDECGIYMLRMDLQPLTE